MTRTIGWKRWLVAALAASACLGAWAGTTCEQRKIGPEEMRHAMQMAVKTRDYLVQADPAMAFVGRVGSDLSAQGLRYTHSGAILRQHPAGPWLFVHELNTCATERSGLYDEGLVNFFLDDLFAFEAVVIVPSPALQARLVQVLNSELANTLHASEYSMIANPFSVRYQNSNQWLLEVLAAALEPEGVVRNRADAQAVLVRRGFQADEIRVSGFQRLGASLFRANVRFDDHDAIENNSGRFRVVSVRSLVRFLDAVDPGAQKVLITLDAAPRAPTRY